MPMTKRSPRKQAQDVLRAWCAEHGIVLDPLCAADLVRRIEAAIARDR